MCVRGPMLMSGYLGDEKATRNTIDENGWLRTGDVGFIKQGKIYIVDRKKVRSTNLFYLSVYPDTHSVASMSWQKVLTCQ